MSNILEELPVLHLEQFFFLIMNLVLLTLLHLHILHHNLVLLVLQLLLLVLKVVNVLLVHVVPVDVLKPRVILHLIEPVMRTESFQRVTKEQFSYQLTALL